MRVLTQGSIDTSIIFVSVPIPEFDSSISTSKTLLAYTSCVDLGLQGLTDVVLPWRLLLVAFGLIFVVSAVDNSNVLSKICLESVSRSGTNSRTLAEKTP